MEGSMKRAVPRVQGSYLEVFCPAGIGRQDTEGPGELKAKAAIVAGIAKEHDSLLIQGVGCRKDTVHQGVPDAATLVGRQHAQRSQSNRGTRVDAGAATHDVPDHFLVNQSDEREGRDYITVVAKGVNEFRLGHIASAGASKRRCVDSEDSCMVVWLLAAQDHEHSVACAAVRAKRVFASCNVGRTNHPDGPHSRERPADATLSSLTQTGTRKRSPYGDRQLGRGRRPVVSVLECVQAGGRCTRAW